MIAEVAPAQGSKVKRPRSAEEWSALTGTRVMAKRSSGRPVPSTLIAVMPPGEALIQPNGHRDTCVVPLNSLTPWLKGNEEQEAILQLHDDARAKAEEKKNAHELMVLFCGTTRRFCAGIGVKNLGKSIQYQLEEDRISMTATLEEATRIMRVSMAKLFTTMRSARLADASCSYMTLPKAEAKWAEVQELEAKEAEHAKAAAIEAKRQARENRIKAAAQARAAKLCPQGPEPEQIALPEPTPIPAVPSQPEAEPLAPQPSPQETAQAKREPKPVEVPELPPLQKALNARMECLRALAYAENLVLECKGRLVMANAEVEIARGG